MVTCTLADSTTPPGQVAQTLARVWSEAPLGYGGDHDAYELEERADRVQMRFVTAGSYDVAATGLIEVRGFGA